MGCAIDTDVNGACLGEIAYSAGREKQSVVYGTIGTGIGFGVYKDGNLFVAEGGHQLIQKHPSDQFNSVCPFHSNCMEGLASGSAMEKRWNKRGVEIEDRNACGRCRWQCSIKERIQVLPGKRNYREFLQVLLKKGKNL